MNDSNWIFGLFGVALRSKRGVSKVTKVKEVVVASLHGGLAVDDGQRREQMGRAERCQDGEVRESRGRKVR